MAEMIALRRIEKALEFQRTIKPEERIVAAQVRRGQLIDLPRRFERVGGADQVIGPKPAAKFGLDFLRVNPGVAFDRQDHAPSAGEQFPCVLPQTRADRRPPVATFLSRARRFYRRKLVVVLLGMADTSGASPRGMGVPPMRIRLRSS